MPKGEDKRFTCHNYTLGEANRVLEWFDHHYHKTPKATERRSNEAPAEISPQNEGIDLTNDIEIVPGKLKMVKKM